MQMNSNLVILEHFIPSISIRSNFEIRIFFMEYQTKTSRNVERSLLISDEKNKISAEINKTNYYTINIYFLWIKYWDEWCVIINSVFIVLIFKKKRDTFSISVYQCKWRQQYTDACINNAVFYRCSCHVSPLKQIYVNWFHATMFFYCIETEKKKSFLFDNNISLVLNVF